MDSRTEAIAIEARAVFLGLVSAGLVEDRVAQDMLYEMPGGTVPGVGWEHVATIGVSFVLAIVNTAAEESGMDRLELWRAMCVDQLNGTP